MNRIAQLRKEKGMNQQQLGKALGAAQNTISNWELGKRDPDYTMCIRLADFFGVSLDYLLGNSDYPGAPTPAGVQIPVLGNVQAGLPISAVQDILDYEEITPELAATGEFFALRIKGRSMEPRMMEGDVVIIRQQDDADTGDTVVVLVNGDDATVKRLRKRPEGIMLVPNNPTFEPLFYSNRDIAELPVRIIGKVVELRGKF